MPILAAIVLLLAIVGLGYGVTQSSFERILIAFGFGFAAYFWQVPRTTERHLPFWIGVAILLRLILIGAFPSLSDDIFRFVWDGRLWLAGANPFDQLPGWYLQEGQQLPGLTQQLFNELNSPDYHTIYPPVAQALFATACWLSPDSIFGAALVMQLFILLTEIGTIFLLVALLRIWNLPPSRVLWYALNPLIIIELTANLHFEGPMIFFFLLGLWLLLRWRKTASRFFFMASAAAMALAVASKLLPLLFFPFLLRRLGWRCGLQYFSLVGLVLAACWLPLLSAFFLENFGSSVNLYFRQFEFNGSLYYLLREFGYLFSGFNLIAYIGPALALGVFLLIVTKSIRERLSDDWRCLPLSSLFAISVYLLCATTVHPWYVALPLVLCVFTPYRWPALWSGMIVLTYINYSYAEFYENLWIVALEYLSVLGYALWEYRRNRELVV